MPSLTRPLDKAFGKVSLRQVLVVPFVVQIVGAVGLIGYLSWQNGQKAVNDLATQLQSEISDRLQQKLSNYLEVPRAINQINVNAIRLGQLDLQDTGSLTRQFWTQRFLFNSVNVSAIYFGSTQGEFFGVGFQDDNTWQIGRAGKSTQGKFHSYAIDTQGNPSSLLDVTNKYDPRIRPWYKEAVKAGKPRWSEIYLDFKEPRQKLTLAQPVYNDSGQLRGVVGVDFVLSHIQEFLKSLKIGRTGQIFIVERTGLLIASSSNEEPFLRDKTGKIIGRLQAKDSRVPLLRSTANYLDDRLGSFTEIDAKRQFIAEIENQRLFLQVAPLKDERGIQWLIVVVVPEADFMEQINANTRTTIFLCLAALIIAIVLGLFTARWICAPILRVSQASYAVAHGNLTQEIQEENIIELEDLAQSFNQMAAQLQESFATLENRVAQRTASLAAAEAELRGLFAAMTELIFVIDAEGRYLKIVSTNPDLLYKPTEELLGKTLDEVFPLERVDTFLGYVRETLETQHPVQCEYSLIIGEKEVWFAASISPISQSSVIWVVRDISDRKRAEVALRTSEEKFSKVFLASPNIITISKPEDGTLIEVNESFVQILGYTREEVIGRKSTELNIWLNRKDRIRLFQKLEAEKQLRGEEVVLRKKSGEVLTAIISVEMIELSDVKLALLVAMDISDRKRVEEALRQSEERNRAILAALPDLVMRCSKDGFFLDYYVPAKNFKDLVPGKPPIGKNFFEVLPPEVAETHIRQIEQTLGAGKIQVFEQEVSIDGVVHYEEARIVPINEREVLRIVRDVSDRKRAEIALSLEQKKSEQLLLNILPKAIADQLKQEQRPIAEQFNEVTILFADIVGFTPLSARMPPIELVNLLNEIFSTFDQLAEKHDLEKIKTIGDAYMVVGGLPVAKDDHAESVAAMALDMQSSINRFQAKKNEQFQIRIGINTGQVVAGVIGIKKFIYDLWGDTVNVASRMESSGVPGNIQVTATTYERLRDKYLFEERGAIEVKGKGRMVTYWLTGRKIAP
jgi:PAS domain S-box-containing protein